VSEAHRVDRARRLFAALTVALAALLAQTSGVLDPLDRWLGDLRFHVGKRPATGEIVLVDVDSRSLQGIGKWPWPRSIHADLIRRLTALGAGEIAFDIDFSTTQNPADDDAFAAALADAGGGVILASFAQAASGRLGDTTLTYNVPIEPFLTNAWTATVNVRPDPDGKIRSLGFGQTIAGTPTQSLSATLAGYAALASGSFPVDFSIRARTIEHVSAIDVLRGSVDKDLIEGKKLIVGATAVELRDLFQVPVYGVVSGTLLQALGAESLIQGRLLKSGGLPIQLGGLIAITALFVFGPRRTRWFVVLGGLAVAAVGIEAVAAWVQAAGALILHTAVWQTALAGFAALTVGNEIDFRRILILISRTETRNVQTILDRVITDNFAGVLVVGPDGMVRAASRAALDVLGFDEDASLVGRTVESVVPPELAMATRSALDHGGSSTLNQPQELSYSPVNGGARILEYVVTPSQLSGGFDTEGHPLPDGVVATLTFVDVTERRRNEERIAYLARFDTLTGLPNRNQFEEALQASLERCRKDRNGCAVIFFDLDRFKAVNDTLGHEYGDRLLTAVARRLATVVRSRDTGDIVARFGGDEWAVLMAGPVTAEDAATLAERLIARVAAPFELDGHRLIVGLSAGIAMPLSPETTVGTLMKNADAALYRAKAAGGGTYRLFDESMETAIRARRELEVELWDAFRREEFHVLFQPQVNLSDRKMVGVEALLRWHHPLRGPISPAEFIPVAEAVGLIEPLGGWVLRRACQEAAAWPVPIKVSVNVSPVQFTRGDLVASVQKALSHSGLPAKRLDLEITESLFMQENNSIIETMERLRRIGVTFSIDDFGTGYSSLSYVRKFPVQKVKIDQSFVRGLPGDIESAAIVRAVSALAQGLNLRINAEGIESEEQAASLRLLGCAEGQGYLFGKPQPAADIHAQLADKQEPRLTA